MPLLEHWRTADGVATAAGWLWWIFLIVTGLSGAAVTAWAFSELAWFWNTFQWAGVIFIGIVTWLMIGIGINLFRGGRTLDPWLIGATFAALALIGCSIGFALNRTKATPEAQAATISVPPAPKAKFSAQTIKDLPPLLAELHRLLDRIVPPAIDAATTAFRGYGNGPAFETRWPQNPKALSDRLEKAQNLIEESGKEIEHFLVVNNLYRDPLSKTIEDENGAAQKLSAIILRFIRINDALIPLAQTNEGLRVGAAALLATQDEYNEAVSRYQSWLDKTRSRIKAQIAEF